MHSTLGRFLLRFFGVSALAAVAATAWAGDFCCQCRDKKTYTIDASDELTAGVECSIKCKRPTRAKAGRCEAPGASTAPGAAQAQSGASAKAASIALYGSEDCSGEAKRVSTSTGKLADAGISGARSYLVESGGGAGAWERSDYAGRKVEMVGPGVCVSPGWEIGSVRFQGQ